MKGKIQLFFLVTGMFLYILNLISDVWQAIRHYRNDESAWFASTLSLIIITIVVTNIATCLHVSNDSFEGSSKWLWLFCPCCPILFRYVEEIRHWKQANWECLPCGDECRKTTCKECKEHLEKKQKLAKSTYMLTWLHLIQTLTECAPQFCLQVYIMLNEWHFPCFTVLSALISFACLLWSITALEQAKETKNNNTNFKLGSAFVFLLWQLFALLSRLSAIVIFAIVLRYYVFCFLGFHWFLVAMAIAIHRRDEFKGEGVGAWIFMATTSLFCVFPLLVFASEPLLAFYKNRRLSTFVTSIVLAVENLILLALSVGISKIDVMSIGFTGKDMFWPIAAACVLGGLALQTVFCVGYYRCCCSRKETESTNEHVSPVENEGFNDC